MTGTFLFKLLKSASLWFFVGLAMKQVRFIDLFAGMGGFRLGFEQAAEELGASATCVFSSEIKPHALEVYSKNFQDSLVHGDITQIDAKDIPDFDVLLAGFPCQAFSSAGKRQGFSETRGTLFFDVERILKEKKPAFFILENVDALVTHERKNSIEPIGETLRIILETLANLGYNTNWQIFDAKDYGLAQSRKRVFIVGSKAQAISLEGFKKKKVLLADIFEKNKQLMNGEFVNLLLSRFSVEQLYGKSIKDKRGGSNNIHSWDLALKGEVSNHQKQLLEQVMRARRRKLWAEKKGIKWMDGMPLTLKEIQTFYNHPQIQNMLDDLVEKGYVRYEHPKDQVQILNEIGKKVVVRQPRTDLEKGYNIVAGKLSFKLNKILDPNSVAPTLVATDLDRVAVPDGAGIRLLTEVEQKRLFGFPDDFQLGIKPSDAFDLFGNTVPIPVVRMVSERILTAFFLEHVSPKEVVPFFAESQLQLY
jgi:DNA (cytosine-5)-methyltransferase 1